MALLNVVLLVGTSFFTGANATADEGTGQPIAAAKLIQQSCLECHNGETSNGELNLATLEWNLADAANRRRWTLVHDRVARGEMPPQGGDFSSSDRTALLKELSSGVFDADYADVISNGRGPIRRLTRDEYEQNLRDILKLPHLDIRDMLPADREQHHCNKVADFLDMSRVQLAAYLNAADAALRHAVASGIKPREVIEHRFPATRMFQAANTYGGREAMFYAKDSKMVALSSADLNRIRKENTHDKNMELAIFRSPSWPYYGYPEGFIASRPGAYRIRFSARAVLQMRDFRLRPAVDSVPMTFRARKRSGPDVSGDVRATGGTIDIQPEVAVYETTIRLKQNETFEYSLLGLPVPRAINPPNAPLYYDFPPMPDGGHPGIAFQWLELSGPIDSELWPPASHKVLFDDLGLRAAKGPLAIELVTEQPEADGIRLLRRFIKSAERQPTADEVIKIYEDLVKAELRNGESLAEALITGYSAFLCSGQFLYLPSPLGFDNKQSNTEDARSASFAIANRLSHLLGNSQPDPELAKYAGNGRLRDNEILSQETDRLIERDRFQKFVNSFTDYWLSLKDVRRDEPDARLYPEYRFDDYLIESMEAETRQFFSEMVRKNLPISVLVDADFAFVNDRLARHYELPPVSGSDLRRITLPKDSPFGGLLVQAAIMKVTANGTTTSPVVRGAWVMDRLLGDPPPPPPKSVPAIEPDLRGATTIRELLAAHTKDASCAGCHARFDPVGFALENFDIMGAWRSRYRSLGSGEKVTGIDRAGHDFEYRIAGTIDTSGKLLDGTAFADIKSLKEILAANPRKLARNLLHRLTLYATGTPVRFSDRRVIEEILNSCSQREYRTRDLMHGLIQSRIFLGASKL